MFVKLLQSRMACQTIIFFYSLFSKHVVTILHFIVFLFKLSKFLKEEKNLCYITNTEVLVQMITCAKTHETCKLNEHFHIAVREFTQDYNIIQHNTANNE